MDRGFEAYNVMAHCQEKGYFFLIRIRDGKQSIKAGLKLPDTDCFDQNIELNLCRRQTKTMKQLYKEEPNSYRFLPATTRFDFLPKSARKADPIAFYELKFRIIRLEISPGNYETLVTNTDYDVETLKNLYASRWSIETSFRDLKYSVGLTHFHAKKKEGILQEIFARATHFNFTKWLATSIPIKKGNRKGKRKRKYKYKICFSAATYACRKFFKGLITSSKLTAYLEHCLSPVRPNRTYKRNIRSQSASTFIYRVA